MHDDFERCYRAVQAKDNRFDGWFVTAVLTTRIYCRPSCPVPPPFARNVRFLPTAAAAQHQGFRACKRCRPDASPGSPEWNMRSDLTARAMRLIADGIVDREGVIGLATRLGYTTRQLERVMQAEVGASPLTLARAQRMQAARVLIETTDLPFCDIAFAAGFSSIRQFNETVRMVCDATPTQIRKRATTRFGSQIAAPGAVSLRLAVRTPFAYEGIFAHLAAGAVPGCEEIRDGAYRRTLRLPSGNGLVALTPATDHVRCVLVLDNIRDLATATARCRRLLDLDADPSAIVEALGADPDLSALVAKAPGQRIPRTVDETELAVRAVMGQQISTKAARAHLGKLVNAYGNAIHDAAGGLTHAFPSIEQLAAIPPDQLAIPEARQWTMTTLTAALSDGTVTLDTGCDWARARRQLLALPGIGPWTAEIIAMRGLGDPDAFPTGDRGLRHAAARLGLPSHPRTLFEYGTRWRPWRSYATQYLWTSLNHPNKEWPPKPPEEAA